MCNLILALLTPHSCQPFLMNSFHRWSEVYTQGGVNHELFYLVRGGLVIMLTRWIQLTLITHMKVRAAGQLNHKILKFHHKFEIYPQSQVMIGWTSLYNHYSYNICVLAVFIVRTSFVCLGTLPHHTWKNITNLNWSSIEHHRPTLMMRGGGGLTRGVLSSSCKVLVCIETRHRISAR